MMSAGNSRFNEEKGEAGKWRRPKEGVAWSNSVTTVKQTFLWPYNRIRPSSAALLSTTSEARLCKPRIIASLDASQQLGSPGQRRDVGADAIKHFKGLL